MEGFGEDAPLDKPVQAVEPEQARYGAKVEGFRSKRKRKSFKKRFSSFLFFKWNLLVFNWQDSKSVILVPVGLGVLLGVNLALIIELGIVVLH